VVEFWSIGVVKQWSSGVLEHWSSEADPNTDLAFLNAEAQIADISISANGTFVGNKRRVA